MVGADNVHAKSYCAPLNHYKELSILIRVPICDSYGAALTACISYLGILKKCLRYKNIPYLMLSVIICGILLSYKFCKGSKTPHTPKNCKSQWVGNIPSKLTTMKTKTFEKSKKKR